MVIETMTVTFFMFVARHSRNVPSSKPMSVLPIILLSTPPHPTRGIASLRWSIRIESLGCFAIKTSTTY